MSRRTLLAIPALLPVAVATAFAQAGLPAPQDYALTNVRIVTAPGKVIDRGTVLIRAGKIAAVGAQVAVPAGVTTMDLAGNTVFPGLIDAATSIGLPFARQALAPDTTGGRGAAGRGGRGAAPPATVGGRGAGGSTVDPVIDAAAEAANLFAPSDDQLKAFRSGGVTTVGLVFQGGIFPGRVGAALTAPGDGGKLALKPAAGEVVAFGTRGRGSYPGTGIGSYAYVRQSILDAQYEGRLDKAARAGTAGAPAPSNDPLSRALMPAATNEMSAWFVASTEREVTRVGEIVNELGLKNAAIVGVKEGWRVIPAIKKSGATAVVSLDWPAPGSITGTAFTTLVATGGRGGGGGGRAGGGGAAGGGAPNPGDPAVMAAIHGNAAALAKAGIPVVLASFGGESGFAFRDKIRATIEAGMSADDALRATTVAPAALLGISESVGTIEVGKLANLVVVSGNDLFAAGSPIKNVFVAGRLY